MAQTFDCQGCQPLNANLSDQPNNFFYRGCITLDKMFLKWGRSRKTGKHSNKIYETRPESKDKWSDKKFRELYWQSTYITCRPIREFFMLIMATLPSTLILYLWAVLVWQW